MLQGNSPKEPKGVHFCWGQRKETAQSYESFTLDGIKYSLYDCVYMWRGDEAEPDIGKLVTIWETESHEKKVEVVWFFRPAEITHWLGDIKPFRKEIFLGCGQGKGLSNVQPLEVISGKCTVVCLSKHMRNPQPTEEEKSKADYIFYRTFDVGKCIVSETFPSSIFGIEVHHFFNRRRCSKPIVCGQPKANSTPGTGETLARATTDGQSKRVEKGAYGHKVPAAPFSKQRNNFPEDGIHNGAEVKSSDTGAKVMSPKKFPSASPSDVSPLRKRKLDSLGISSVHPLKIKMGHGLFDAKTKRALTEGSKDDARPHTQSRVSGHDNHMNVSDSCKEKKELSTRVNLDKTRNFPEKGDGNKRYVSPKISYDYMEVKRRPDTPWVEERLFEAHDNGTLILLENLDPSFTSAEVEDIVWHAFEQKVNAKMLQYCSFSSPHSGQAFAIFKTQEAADNVISQLTKGCLMLGDGRPIVARRKAPIKSGHSSGFAGHLSLDRTRSYRKREEMKNAVSTSHYSQANTIEYEMALEWLLLQQKSGTWWPALYEEQRKEIKHLLNQLKTSVRI